MQHNSIESCKFICDSCIFGKRITVYKLQMISIKVAALKQEWPSADTQPCA